MKIRNAFLLVLMVANFYAFGQSTLVSVQKKGVDTQVNWMSWEEAMARSKQEERKIMIDIYTDWCKWCERMDEMTFQEPEIVKFINENFYPVKFDAQQINELEYEGKTYSFVKSGKRGYHELAQRLMQGRLSFPTIVFLNEKTEVIQCIVGFKTPSQFEKIAAYFAEDHYKKTPWSTFEKNYQPASRD